MTSGPDMFFFFEDLRMSIDYNELVGKIVSFSLYAPAVLGNGYNNVRIIGIVSAPVARTFDDIVAKHSQVYGSLPPGTTDNYTAYEYILIEDANGVTIPIGVPWVNGSITEFVSSMTYVAFPNLTAARRQELEYILKSNNFNDFDITYKQT